MDPKTQKIERLGGEPPKYNFNGVGRHHIRLKLQALQSELNYCIAYLEHTSGVNGRDQEKISAFFDEINNKRIKTGPGIHTKDFTTVKELGGVTALLQRQPQQLGILRERLQDHYGIKMAPYDFEQFIYTHQENGKQSNTSKPDGVLA